MEAAAGIEPASRVLQTDTRRVGPSGRVMESAANQHVRASPAKHGIALSGPVKIRTFASRLHIDATRSARKCPLNNGRVQRGLAWIHRLAGVSGCAYPRRMPSEQGKWWLRRQPFRLPGGHLLEGIFAQPEPVRGDLR